MMLVSINMFLRSRKSILKIFYYFVAIWMTKIQDGCQHHAKAAKLMVKNAYNQ